VSLILHCLKILCTCRRGSKTRARYSDYDVPGEEDPEISSLFSETPLSDVYDVPYTCDPYAAFDPDVSVTPEDDNHELTESGNTQRSFKKIGDQWGAMVTPHSVDPGRSHKDNRTQYSEEKSIRRVASSRCDRYKNHNGWMRPAATQTVPGQSPELSVQDQAVGTSPRVMHLVSEEVQTAVDDTGPSPQSVEENGLTPGDGILNSAASTNREMTDSEVQCTPQTTDLLKKEYIRLTLFCD